MPPVLDQGGELRRPALHSEPGAMPPRRAPQKPTRKTDAGGPCSADRYLVDGAMADETTRDAAQQRHSMSASSGAGLKNARRTPGQSEADFAADLNEHTQTACRDFPSLRLQVSNSMRLLLLGIRHRAKKMERNWPSSCTPIRRFRTPIGTPNYHRIRSNFLGPIRR